MRFIHITLREGADKIIANLKKFYSKQCMICHGGIESEKEQEREVLRIKE
jgi:hypothetical protein